MNGDQHKQHRRIVQGPFQKKAILAYHDTVSEMSRELVESWSLGETRDMTSEMTHYMLRLTSRILFGLDLPELAYKVGDQTERWISLNQEVGPAAFCSYP
jgi:cytochrome P450